MLGPGGVFVCGADTGSPVRDKHQPPFKFAGTLYGTTVDVSGELIKDDEHAMKVIIARQHEGKVTIDQALEKMQSTMSAAS